MMNSFSSRTDFYWQVWMARLAFVVVFEVSKAAAQEIQML
jgi:hypothetical protein